VSSRRRSKGDGQSARRCDISLGSGRLSPWGLAATVPLDDWVNQSARVDDLHPELMRAFLDEVGSELGPQADRLDVGTLGRQMQVVRGPQEAALPVNVGLMFFHRGYDTREPVEVRISPEDLVVLSYPGPDRAVRLEQLRDGRAARRGDRNRRIGEFLKELHLTEGRATWIPKMLRVMRANGSPPPEFEFDEDHTYFMVRLPVHPGAIHDSAGEVESHLGATGQVTGQVERLLRALHGEMSRHEIQEALRLTHRDHFMDSYLKPALADELVERTIPDKPRSRLQKYRLTEQGRAWLRGDAGQGDDDA